MAKLTKNQIVTKFKRMGFAQQHIIRAIDEEFGGLVGKDESDINQLATLIIEAILTIQQTNERLEQPQRAPEPNTNSRERELLLRERELNVRERELMLRERERTQQPAPRQEQPPATSFWSVFFSPNQNQDQQEYRQDQNTNTGGS